MIAPELPTNEKERQKAVEKYQLLDTPPEENYDNITSLISYICDTPISLITLLDRDRNFLKSHYGIPFNESPREISFCGHAINSEETITIIEDARIDERFHDNPLVAEHNAVFYAGVPMVDPDGYKLGTLCVYDIKPRKLTTAQENALINLSKQVMVLFEARYKNVELQRLQANLEQRNKNLEKFASVVSHDLKSPLAQIKALTELLEQDIKDVLDDDTKQYLEYIKESSDSLRGYIDGILKYYKADGHVKNKKSRIHVSHFMEEMEGMFKGDRNVIFNKILSCDIVHMNKSAMSQIFVNLISNAIKYNNKPKAILTVVVEETDDLYQFSVTDNGPGIPEELQESVFELFTTTGLKDKDGNMGTGIGLATVKKVITQLGGEITLNSQLDNGCTFNFFVPKV